MGALVAGIAATLLYLIAPGAEARTALVELRVEGPTAALDPGTWYVTGTERVKRGRGDACRKRKGLDTYRGPNALGLLATAQGSNGKLSPVRARPTDFGPQVCQVGKLRSFGHYPNANGGFLYWTNYVAASSSADLVKLRNRDQVLWYYAAFPAVPRGQDPVNMGNPLELRRVPARDADGEFEARVVIHDFDGTPAPVNDATILGAESATPLGNGEYAITVANGTSTLTAARGQDVRSNHVPVCVRAELSRCPKAHGRTIVGSGRGDELKGTRGFDRISSGGGDDRVNLRQGGRDRVKCGGGGDLVLLDRGDRDDRVADSCERVRRS
jgi:hypothetical protein